MLCCQNQSNKLLITQSFFNFKNSQRTRNFIYIEMGAINLNLKIKFNFHSLHTLFLLCVCVTVKVAIQHSIHSHISCIFISLILVLYRKYLKIALRGKFCCAVFVHRFSSRYYRHFFKYALRGFRIRKVLRFGSTVQVAGKHNAFSEQLS